MGPNAEWQGGENTEGAGGHWKPMRGLDVGQERLGISKQRKREPPAPPPEPRQSLQMIHPNTSWVRCQCIYFTGSARVGPTVGGDQEKPGLGGFGSLMFDEKCLLFNKITLSKKT